MKIGKTAAKIFLLYTGLTIAYTSSVLGQSIDDISNFLFNNTTLKESVAVSDKSSNMTKKLNETLNKTLSRKHNLKLRTKVQDLDEIINGVEEINLLYVEKQKNKKFKYVIGNEEVEKHETVQNIDIPTNIRIDSLTIKDLNEYITKVGKPNSVKTYRLSANDLCERTYKIDKILKKFKKNPMLRSFFEGAEDSYKPLATWVRSWKKQSYFGNTKEDITFYRFKYSPHAFIQIKDKVFITTDYRAYLFSEVCNMKSEPVKAVTSLFNYICDGDCHSPEVRQREWIRDILVPILSTIGAYKIAK